MKSVIVLVALLVALCVSADGALAASQKQEEEYLQDRYFRGLNADDDLNPDVDDTVTDDETAPASVCFSSMSSVQVEGHSGAVSMKDLKIGDKILTGSGKYQPVYAFGHRNEEIETEFLQLVTMEGKPLEMTAAHLVFVQGKTSPVRADSVQKGDMLLTQNSAAAAAAAAAAQKVLQIHTIRRKGVYAPFTQEGTLVVDGIVASSYIGFHDQNEQFMTSFISHHDYVHMGLSPFRLLCMGISSNLCTSYNQEGFPSYAGFATKVNEWLVTQCCIVQSLALFAVFVLTGICLALETLFGPTWAPTIVALVGIIIGAMKAFGLTVSFRQSNAKPKSV